MGRKKEIEVGGVLTRKNGKKYRVVEHKGCISCAFHLKPNSWCDGIPCNKEARSDSLDVIFHRIA